MGKNKGKANYKNKEACEFVLVNRGMDDPNFQNPNASHKVLLHVPKEEEEMNVKHKKIIEKIPEISRGVYTEDDIRNNLRDLGVENINYEKSEEELKRRVDEINKENFIKKVHVDLSKTEVVEYGKNSKIKVEPVEEEVNTFSNPSKSGKDSKGQSHKQKEKEKVIQIPKDLTKLEDDKLAEVLKIAKISAEVTEYNKFGLKKNIDPEVLNYVTDKEFVEGVDIFIPAPGNFEIDHNRFDVDIAPEKMDKNYKEVYEALQSDEEGAEELEDDFVLLANEGVIPIEINEKTDVNTESKDKDEFVLAETNDKTKVPSYKYITKEEREFIDKQFEKTMKEYDNKDSKDSKDNKSNEKNNEKANLVKKGMMEEAINELIGNKKSSKGKKYNGLTANYQDEEEFEDYELDDDEDNNEFVEIEKGDYNEEDEDEEYEDDEDEEKDKMEENKIEFCENNFKIEYVGGKTEKKRKPKVAGSYRIKTDDDLGTFTVEDLQKLIKDEGFVEKTKEMIENKKDVEEEDNEGLPIYFIKKRLDITTVHGKIGHLPKTIGLPDKSIITEKTAKNNNPPTETSENKKQIIISTNKHHIGTNLLDIEETKEQKKIRKKLLKEEKQEKRKQKKELKVAFKSEKCKQMKQIANTNQVIRYGLSVKEI